MRKLIVFAGLVAMFCLAWAAAWHYGANAVEAGLDQQLARTAGQGLEIACANRQIGGFPFSFVVSCEAIAAEVPREEIRAVAGAQVASIPLYRPGNVTTSAVGPLRLQIGDANHRIAWKDLRLRLAVSTFGLVRLALDRDATDDLEVELTGADVQAERDGRALAPAFSVSTRARLDGVFGIQPRDLRDHVLQNGISGEIYSLELAPAAGGQIGLSGPFGVGADGLISARLDITTGKLAAIADFLAAAIDDREAAKRLQQAAMIIAAAGFGSSRSQRLTLTIDRGAVTVGVIPLGRIPPLF